MSRPSEYRRPGLLVSYLNKGRNWNNGKAVPLPQITRGNLLQRARNGVRRSKDNNALLEFLGDRVNNLACSLMVQKVKRSSEHHKTVGRVLCNNDTIGRIAYQLRLHEKARLCFRDEEQVFDWIPCDGLAPPKAFADLFEAYVGAVYEEHGWDTVMKWLTALYEPLIALATKDFLRRSGPGPARHLPEYFSSLTEVLPAECATYQAGLLDYLQSAGPSLVECGQMAINALPYATQFFFGHDGRLADDSRRANSEVGMNVINLWVCNVFMRGCPHFLQATHGASHVMTWITHLVTNDETLGFIGSLLSLSSFFDIDEVEYNSTRSLINSRKLDNARQIRDTAYRSKLSLSLKAIIGSYYLQDSASATKWGEAWFKSIVVRCHDIIAEDPDYQAWLPQSARHALSRPATAVASSVPQKKCSSTSLDDLTRDLENITISGASSGSDTLSRSETPASKDDDAVAVAVVLRTQDDSLKKSHPVPDAPQTANGILYKDSEIQEANSQKPTVVDTPISKHDDSAAKTKNSVKLPSSSNEQNLKMAFRHMKVKPGANNLKNATAASNNATVRAPLKIIINPDTAARLKHKPRLMSP